MTDNCEDCGYDKSAHQHGCCPTTATPDSFQDQIRKLEDELATAKHTAASYAAVLDKAVTERDELALQVEDERDTVRRLWKKRDALAQIVKTVKQYTQDRDGGYDALAWDSWDTLCQQIDTLEDNRNEAERDDE